MAERTRQGWDSIAERVEVPEWLKKVLRIHEDMGTGGSGGPGDEGDPKQSRAGGAAVVGASAAAYGYDESDQEDPRDAHVVARDDQMMVLTKKMIEIRSILQQVGQSRSLTLPSIVVIGSQSSGKSSVLEAIVGHEFLPKGSNMVTRRPIELTLVHTPGSNEEYGEFPDLGLRHITDFSSVQRTLTELNLAVSDAECVSDDPIHLTVYSPNVPDLSLIDLPGYIQVIGQNQPLQLKLKISELCEKYIQPPNVILAISAADVDLANSTALRASRRVDPRGDRTIGVITKMDLVDPGKGAAILNDKQYPLRLGYVGVVSKAHQSPGLFNMGLTNPMAVIAKHEYSFFSAHPLEYGPDSGVSVGTTTLRRKLMQVLEQTMSSSLQGTSDAVKKELDEADYEFKVQYNGRPLSAEAYLAEGLDAFKHSFRKFANGFRRPEMLELLKNELDQEVLNVLAAKYWNKLVEEDLSATHPDPNPIANLPQADPSSVHWHAKLDASTSALTRLGVGRLGTTVVASSLKSHIDKLIDNSNFATHPFAKKAVKDAAAATLDEMFLVTCDKVESYLKPFKFEIDVEKREWEQGRQHVGKLLKEELRECKAAMGSLESAAGGRRKLMEVMGFVDKARRGDIVIEGDGRSNAGEFSPALLSKGKPSPAVPASLA